MLSRAALLLRRQHAIILVALIASTSCGQVERIYTYTRQAPAMGRTSPTTFEVRVHVDGPGRKVTWIEDVHDREGDLGRAKKDWCNCDVFDQRNWTCPGPIPEMRAEMRDGRLREY